MTTEAVLFDFFGTLVSYSPSWTEQGYRGTHALVASYGCALDYQHFLDQWSEVISRFAEEAAVSEREYLLRDATAVFLRGALGRTPRDDEIVDVLASYMGEWNKGVTHLEGMTELLGSLAERHRLGIISNTNEPGLVPRLLSSMGVLHYFQSVTLSVEVGWRKPNPEIFTSALDAVGVDPSRAVVVGDSYEADYLGAKRSGIRALLIDPDRLHPIPTEDRVASVFDVLARLDE